MDVCLFVYVGMGFGIPKAPQDFIVGQLETFLMLLGVQPEQSTLNLEERVLFTQYRLIKNGFECSLHTVSYIFPLFISQVYFSRFHNDLFNFVKKNCAQNHNFCLPIQFTFQNILKVSITY